MTDQPQNNLPPLYSDLPVDIELPPEYTTSVTYTIGGQTLDAPFVSASHVKAHLCLLRSIHKLKTTMESGDDKRIPPDAIALHPAQRWAWFVGLAVERFSRWVTSVKVAPLDKWLQEELPPVDVLMVWHAYLLNPIWYAEDCARLPLMRPLKELGSRLLSSLVKIGDISLYVPSDVLQSSWFEKTETLWDPFDALEKLTHRNLVCPQCDAGIAALFIHPNGTGYLQSDFQVQCSNCSLAITHEVLSVAKFARDFVIDPDDPAELEKYGQCGVYLAGTYLSTTRGPDARKARFVKTLMRNVYPLGKPKENPDLNTNEWRQHVQQATKYSMKIVKSAAMSCLVAKNYNVQRVFSAYCSDRPFAVDLLATTVRQSAFVEQIHECGWTEDEHFGEDAADDLALAHAINRYHAFMDLVSSAPKILFPQALLVPTLDIDLMWHTHQLMGGNYIAHCAKYLQYLFDHPDVVEEHFLASSFDSTCRAWRERFDIPYIYCGCPLPGDKIAERLGRLMNVLRSSSPSGDLVPLPRADALLATHVSDHSAFPVAGTDALREKRIKKVSERQRRASRSGQTAPEHQHSFLVPLAIYDGASQGAIMLGGIHNDYTWVLGAGGGNDGYAQTTGAGRAGVHASASMAGGLA